jgi:zinc transport system substrate-binding protein
VPHRIGRMALVVVCVGLLSAGCGSSSPKGEPSEADLGVTVSIVPQAYFVERIGGDHVAVQVMVEPGQSPHTYEPKPEQLVALSQSDAYFSIGVSFEDAWMERIAAANPTMLLVDTTAGIQRRSIEAHEHGEDKDQHEGEADESGELFDPHIWLAPRLVKVQVGHIAAALAALDPDHASIYEENLAAFEAEIDALDAEIDAQLADVTPAKFLVFHPSWGYFADAYGLEQVAIEVGGQEPSAAELSQLITLARTERIRVVFAQPEFSTRTADVIADEIGGRVLLIDPLARDWGENLRNVARTMAEVLGEE